jgi:hypothetical protein
VCSPPRWNSPGSRAGREFIDRIAAAQREELEQEIAELAKEARAREEEIEELVGSLLF